MSLLTITDSANEHLSGIVQEHNAKGVMLGVKGGGCAGFTYEWSILLEAIPVNSNATSQCGCGESFGV